MRALPSGHIRLILSRKHKFYLEIPLDIITALCLNAHEYLRYLGWCVLGVIGNLTDREENPVNMDGMLIDQGVYIYLVDEEDFFPHAIDPKVWKKKKSEFSASTETRGNFADDLLERDGYCVWCGDEFTEGMHIIAHRQGTDWLRLLLDNRPQDPNYPQELDRDIDINDIRNGITACHNIHKPFDRQMFAVLKAGFSFVTLYNFSKPVPCQTPNHILTCDDIPASHPRSLRHGYSFPAHSRYTLQWLVTRDEIFLARTPNNDDAAFLEQDLPKPGDLFLHYMYGVAAVKNWGKNTEILSTHSDMPSPSKQATDEMGPKRTLHDRTIALNKRNRNLEDNGDGAKRGEGSSGKHGTGAQESVGEMNDSEPWDEHDVVLFFWSNTRVARERQERRAKAEEERKDRLEKWRLDISS